MKIKNIRNTLVLFLLLVGIGNLEKACAQREKKSVIEIDATYMKAYIYDYEANPSEFVYKGKLPAIIDFYATWCGPCRSLAPKLEQVAKEYQGKIVVYKVDIDKNPKLADHFGVQSIPTILFVPLDDRPYLSKGNLPREDILTMIQKILPKK